MSTEKQPVREALTGRIQEPPDVLLHETVLHVQFSYELQHLLPHYIKIEKALVSEYERLGLLAPETGREIVSVLDHIDQQVLTADPQANMSDISFAIERYVEAHIKDRAANWHVDRSRNDVQATAQLMFARESLLGVIEALLEFARAVYNLSEDTVELPMPGYTHYQAAQVITAGFYLAAMNEQLGKTLHRLQTLFEEINECPLGSGAMAGLELPWDRQALAEQLGFRRPVRHALVAVASKEWVLHIAAELSTASVTFSRFVTDLITWGSSEYRLIDLPDQLSGISSAMPQKKNFPILERIRGKTAHITAYYLDFVMSQRNTPYTNLVETAKEGGSNFFTMISSMQSLIKLFTIVVQHLRFQKERMYAICAKEFLGGFTLANLLSLQAGIPYRQAQVLSGRYIMEMMSRDRLPHEVDSSVLRTICLAQGYTIDISEEALQQAFSVEHNLSNKRSPGSTRPEQIRALLQQQKRELDDRWTTWQRQRAYMMGAHSG